MDTNKLTSLRPPCGNNRECGAQEVNIIVSRDLTPNTMMYYLEGLYTTHLNKLIYQCRIGISWLSFENPPKHVAMITSKSLSP